jgi:uncharacterized repeat protein (TIGR01451 family)
VPFPNPTPGACADSEVFEAVVRELLSKGLSVRFQAHGASMSPAIRDGEFVEVTPVIVSKLRKDDIVLAKSNYGFRLHRIVFADFARDVFITRGDCGQENDPALTGAQILGLAKAKEVRIGRRLLQARFQGVMGQTLRCAARAQYVAQKLFSASSRTNSQGKRTAAPMILLCLLLLGSTISRAQVAVDSASSNGAELTGTGNPTLTISHTTTTTGSNLLMLVGVSIDISRNTATAVTSVKNGTTALTLVGAHNDAGGTRRVEIWSLLAPATGTATVTVTVNIPSNTTEGVAAGVVTFTGVDQSVPLGTFVSADGANVENSQLDVPSVVNGMILDTVAIGGGETSTVAGPQVQEWNVNTGASNTRDVTATGSARTGAPSVPLSEAFNANTNWSLGAISINPTAADIGVTTSVSAVALGQNSTYNITITNHGTSAANNVTLTDTFASANLSVVSVTPSTGTNCTTSTTINCTLPTPLASGASATVAVKVATTAAGFYPNTATITDSGTPPDLNTGNNTYVALAPVVSVLCGTSALSAGGTLTGVINTYYPGAASVSAGAISIPLGTANGSGAIAFGTELLVIQMQDASINDSNSGTYGNGSTGTGFTAINNAGNYEFVTATGPISGGSVPILGAGVGGGLVFGYNASAATGSKGVSTYQVVIVPQYTSATLSSTLTAAAWNGSTGGILAVDVANTLTLNTATVSVSGLGFRGGAGLQLSGTPNPAPPTAIAPLNTDYQQQAPATYTATTTGSTSNGEAGWDASKGEGIAGTPAWVESGGTFLATGTGYPSGAFGAFTLSSVAAATGGDTVYTGTFTGGAGNTLAGYTFLISGFANSVNNGRFVSTASTATTLTLVNANGIAETNPGTANIDGSMGHGAPGNAGGGATDADPQKASTGGNDQNAGGGGGANGGSGGFGGDSWNSNLSSGGEGGSPFPATIDRLAMGGGGGAGTRNNSDGDNQASSGSSGGGIVFIRAFSFSGTATITANGANAYNGTANDAGGGGGAGGTIVMLAANGGEGGLTLQANGGAGGNAWQSDTYNLADRHGPGGGGGGGIVFVSGTPAGVSVTGGADGLTLNPGVAYGSTNGSAGTSVANATLSQVTGLQSAEVCTRLPDLAMSKSHGGGTLTRGSTATYTLQATNVNTAASSGVVTINDTLPLGTTPVSASGTGWTCSISSQTISCTTSNSLAGGATYPAISVVVNVTQAAPSTITNTSMVAGGGDISPLNDTATDVAVVGSTADLSVSDAASPDPVAAGSNITYTQVVTNNGPSAADNATLVTSVPANTTFVSIAVPAGWNCATPAVGGTGNIVCNDVDMVGGTNSTFTMVTKVNTPTANGTVITNGVSVSSSVSDPNAANNTASASTVVGTTTGGELTVTNVASPNPVQAGNPITYTQVVTNTGSAAATGATFTEATPANTTFVSITPPAGWNCTGFPGTPCSDPSVPAGSAGTGIFTVIYKVTAGTANGTTITDTATVNATNQAFGANSATATDIVGGATQADLSLSTASTPLSVFPGNNITYTQTITNNGPAAVAGASFTEAIPANATFESVMAPAGWTCTSPAVGATTGNVVCTGPASLASGTSANIVVVIGVPSTVTAASITANASVTATTLDPNSTNNSTTTVTPVQAVCDLAVTNSGTPNPITAGATITYTQTVTNTGPSSCSTATFTEPTPSNTTFQTITAATGWSCAGTFPPQCADASVPAGYSGTFTVTYKVNATATGSITDTATVATTSRDSNLANNSATSTIGVTSSTLADLSVTNSASPNPVTAGNTITYTQSVTNNGQAAASTVSFTDPIPANTTLVSLAGPGTWTCTTTPAPPTCTITSLAANTTANFTLMVTVNAGVATGTITQTDSVTSSTGDPNSTNNSATASVGVADSANLSITNTDSPVPVAAGSNITYAQTVTNSGPSTASTVNVTETLPANTTAVSLSGPTGWICTLATLTCTDSSFAVGSASFSYVVTVTAATPSGTAINETATVTSATADPNVANNSATAADVVASSTQTDLVVTNSATPISVSPGSNVTYTQSVTDVATTAATGVSFTQTTPPNTTFQSITPPTGWTCGTKPAVGGTGTITCTDGSSLATGTANTANFTLILSVNSTTPSGTSITETDTATATNGVSSPTASSSATVLVANANSADVAITKTGTPNPVTQGTPLTYTLTVTNNGPASATTVQVMDMLPSSLTYLSSTVTPSSQGTCSEAGASVTCQLGTMANGATATISILTIPEQAGQITNTAMISADQTDPNATNNTSSWIETVTAPTSITLQSFSAYSSTDKNGASRVILAWKTGGEAHNLGFNVYREQNGSRVRVNSSVIAGSALLMKGALVKHTGRSYAWIDSSAGAGSGSYWLEDIDVNGTHTLHGPISAQAGTDSVNTASASESRMLSQLNQAPPQAPVEKSHLLETMPFPIARTPTQLQKQFDLAAHPAVKILVQNEGWYRITQPELVKAGLDPNVDPALLHLYAEANEQPIQITGATPGPGGFGPQAAINFYGTGIDTIYSGTRVYWLAAEQMPGLRMAQLPAFSGSNQPLLNYPATVELQQHLIYFSALLTWNGENFFGAIVSPTPVDQVLNVTNLDQKSTQAARLEITLQGVIVAFPHDVQVAVNGTTVGDLTFTGQAKGQFGVNLPPGSLQEGGNTVTLTSQNGEYDTSLVQSIQITYPHKYVADSDALKFTGRTGDQLVVGGFTTTPIVLDITDPNNPVHLMPQVTTVNGTYQIALQVPWVGANPAASARHTFLAVGADQIGAAPAIANHPSHWHEAQPGADIAMVTYDSFAYSLAPLAHAHLAESARKTSAIVPITDLYDEFNFGEKTPQAIRQFLQTANQNWKTPPTYLLLNGRASFDPRNYLGMGDLDLVPTQIVPAGSLMTASDDWFSDFTNKGMPTIATGRLPVATLDDVQTVVGKIVAYKDNSTNGAWTSNALMVADRNDTENFTQDAQSVQAQLPKTIQATDVFTGLVGTDAARQQIVAGINSGQLLVNYTGHGSEEQWSGSNIFNTETVSALTNSSQLPVFLVMDCLNGFFQDVYAQPLAVTLLLAPNGGAVATLASTGLNQPAPQTQLDKLIVQNVLSSAGPTLGDSILKAKSQIGDVNVRKTFVLFGDPAMKIKQPSASSAAR